MKKIIFQHPFILLFGVLQLFFSAPGQTVIISLFVASIFDDIGVSRTVFAGLYSAATLGGSLFLNPVGRLIDKYPVKFILIGISISMAVGCFLLAGAHDVITIFCAFFLLRLVGQGVFGLTASTILAKTFEANRGKAMGVMSLGFPLSEMIYPVIAVFLLSTFGWRISYCIFGISNLFIMLPLQIYLVHKSKIIKGELLPGESVVNPQRLRGQPENRKIPPQKDFTLGEALRDLKFYLLVIAGSLPPVVITGMLFHQNSIFAANNWPIILAANVIGLYAICKAIGSIGIGSVVDRYGPLGPFVILILLLGLGTFIIGLGGSQIILFIAFGIIGLALGFTSPVMNVLWPSLYGTKHLGSIKGFVGTVRNGITAFGPLPIAMALDAGYGMNVVMQWIAGLIIVLAILPVVVSKMR